MQRFARLSTAGACRFVAAARRVDAGRAAANSLEQALSRREVGNIVVPSDRVRYAIVGTGARAGMYLRALAADHRDTAEVVALADVNPARMATHNRWLARTGAPPAATYPAGEFRRML